MIRSVRGNLLEAPAEVLVNAVNEVGVMGKGLALQFRDAFPESAKAYQDACKRKAVQVGRVLVTPSGSLMGPRWIIHFPTKRHWRHPSRLAWVHDGLEDLVRVVRQLGIRSIAIPPLGCGNGGLEWRLVRREIEAALGSLTELDVQLFEPTAEYHTAPKAQGVASLTPARALIAELIRRYEVMGLECTQLEVQKLAWFLQRSIRRLGLVDPLDLRFGAHVYGPYADRLRHLLDAMDGSYLHSERRLADAGPLDPIRFDDAKRAEVAAYLDSDDARPFQQALERTARLIDGFESPLGMELLATLDWLLVEGHCEPTLESICAGLAAWPGGPGAAQRKQRIFEERLIELGLERLREAV